MPAKVELLSSKFTQLFKQEFFKVSRVSNRSPRVNCANFISILYSSKVVDPVVWPAPRVLDEMYNRGYHTYVTQKLSIGVEAPPMLSYEDALKWVCLFKLLEMKRLEI